MKLNLLIFLQLFILNHCIAQVPSKEDSLLNIVNATKIDTVKIKAYIELGTLYSKINPEQAVKYTKEGISFSVSRNVDNKLADLYYNLGVAYNALGYADSAVQNLNTSFGIAKKKSNVVLQAKSLTLIGSTFTNQAKYKEAAENLFKALDIAETSTDPTLAATVYSNLSVLFYNQINYEKAITYGEKALQILKKDGDPKTLGTSYLNLGLVYADKGDETKARAYYTNALLNLKKADATLHIATVYGNLSLIEHIDFNKKIEYLLEAQKIWDAVAPDHPNAVGNLGNLGSAYLYATYDTNFVRLKEDNGIVKDKAFLLNKAEALLTKACEQCKKMEFDRDLHYFTGQLAEVEEAKGNYKMATQHLHEYITLNDSIYSQENKNKIAAVEGEREVAIRDKEIQLNKLAISTQNKVRIGLIAGLLLLAVIGTLLFWQSRTRRRTNTTLLTLNNELDEANKVKARFFGIISHDLRSPVANLISFLNVQQEAPELISKEKAAEHRAAITASAESLLETMEAMLQWSKSQMENFKPQLKETSVDHLFQNIQANFAAGEGYTIRFNNAQNLLVTTDEDYLKTIVHNLTANAIKALKQQPGGLIEWRAYEENGKVILSITDNGPGANEQQIEALYNKEAAVNSKNGLGLHLIRDLARAIHCVISFSSKPGLGTTFQLTLN